jgi:hypothetical protein
MVRRSRPRGHDCATVHVATWIEDFPGSKPTVKLKVAAVRMLYDFLVVRQITRSNPAHSVRGPKYVVKKGKTPVWSREDAKTLLNSIPKDSVSGGDSEAGQSSWFSHASSDVIPGGPPVSRFTWKTTDGLSTPSRWRDTSPREQPNFTTEQKTRLH